jgi:hypothetical protein
MKVIDSLLNIIEMYINKIEKRKILLNEQTIETISMIFYNTGNLGSNAGSKEEKNKFKNYFDENNKLNILLNLFKYLVLQTLSPIQEETLNNISITICLLLKNERPPLCYGCVLEHVNNLKSSPSPAFGYDFPSDAKKVWDEMSKADQSLWNYQFSKTNIPENFRIMKCVFILWSDMLIYLCSFFCYTISYILFFSLFIIELTILSFS